MVAYTLDAPPTPTGERRRELETPAAPPDDRIDTSEMPELAEAQWAEGVRGRFYRPVKR